jgi:hypothetical protein
MSDRIPLWELAARVVSGQGRIAVAVVPRNANIPGFSAELGDELAALSGAEVRLVVASSARAIEDTISSGVLAVIATDSLSAAQWRALDHARSRLNPLANVVLVADVDAAKRMTVEAPGLSSWLGGSVYLAGTQEDELSDTVREERLVGLRNRYSMTDPEAIRSAERGDAPSDPEFAVWLVLLGRADLVAGRDD